MSENLYCSKALGQKKQQQQ